MADDFLHIPNKSDNLFGLSCLIKAKDSNFSVSRSLLMSKSTVLAKELFKDMMGQNTRTVEMDETSDMVKGFVNFLHTGKVTSLESKAPILLPFSIKYGVTDMEKLCLDYLNKSMHKDNAFKRLELAVSCKSAELRKSALDMHLRSYKTLEEFQEDLKTSKWESLLSKDKDISNDIMEHAKSTFFKQRRQFIPNKTKVAGYLCKAVFCVIFGYAVCSAIHYFLPKINFYAMFGGFLCSSAVTQFKELRKEHKDSKCTGRDNYFEA